MQKQLSNAEDIKNIFQKAKTRKLTIQSKHTLTLHDMNIYSIIRKLVVIQTKHAKIKILKPKRSNNIFI